VSLVARILLGLLLLGLMAGGLVWYLHLKFKKDEEGTVIAVLKWALTLVVLFTALVAVPWFGIPGLVLIVACGIAFSLVWAPGIGAFLVRPLTSAFDGGNTPVELKPLYSPAEVQRKRGHYHAAVAEVRKQLEQFPRDFDGQMLLATIHAEDLGDLEHARTTIQRLVNQPGHPPKHRAYALTQMADWELARGHDPEAARQRFEQIQRLFPGTEHAVAAAQRIAHLPAVSDESPPATHTAMPDSADGAAARADELTRHLARHPLDAEAREELVGLLAEELEQPDLALQQLEMMIVQPNQPPRQIARWLNRAADVHAHQRNDADAAHAALQRIIDLFPGTQFAGQAASRQAYLSMELRGKKTSRALKLGSYEDDLGLKAGPT